jgi:hypothetical protein
MNVIRRKLGSGQHMLFDKEHRSLYLIDGSSDVRDIKGAEQLVQAGKAKKFDKRQLGALQEAFSAVLLLG